MKKCLHFIYLIVVCLACVTTGRMLLAANPSSMTQVSLSRPMISTSTNIFVDYSIQTTLPTGSYIVLSIDPAMTIPPDLAPSDVTIELNGITQTVASLPANNVFGYEKAGGNIRIYFPLNQAINSGEKLRITIGKDGGFITPPFPGSYSVASRFFDSNDVSLGGIVALFIIAKPLGATANIDEGDLQIRVIHTLPELRDGPPLTNNQSKYFLSFRYGSDFLQTVTPPSLADQLQGYVLGVSGVFETDPNGSDSQTRLASTYIDASYDIGIKTDQHLTRILRNIELNNDFVTDINFTDPLNGPSMGEQVLLAGDINEDMSKPSEMGDDVINSIDLSILLSEIDFEDPLLDQYRSNLNKDQTINSVDLSIMLKNLDIIGER